MSDELAKRTEQFASGHYRPTTFLERGVVVPFTTPMLLGARLRLAEHRGLELVIANPSGGRGFYVVAWNRLPEICGPTLHDERLWWLLSQQANVTPSAVRAAARAVVLDGYRGRAAAAAEAQAVRDGPTGRLDTVFMLLLRLIRQTELPEEATLPPEHDTPVQRDARGKRAILRVAARLEFTPSAIGDSLHELATLLQDVGAAGEVRPARARRQVAAIATMVQEVNRWAAATPAAQELEVAPMIAEVADLTLQCCATVLGQIDAELADMPRLLQRWRADRGLLSTLVARVDWLLDGWSLIAALWRDARPGERLAASWEMAMLVPVLPREAEAWCGVRADWERPWRQRRVVRRNEDWRTGHMHTLVARSERLLMGAA